MDHLSLTEQKALTTRVEALLKERLHLRPFVGAQKVLGISRTSWHEYRTGTRPLPLYIERSLRLHLALSPADLERHVRPLVNGGDTVSRDTPGTEPGGTDDSVDDDDPLLA